MTAQDVLMLSPKFWEMHIHPTICIDFAATTLLTIQYNLVVGTIAAFAKDREDLRPLVKDLLEYKTM